MTHVFFNNRHHMLRSALSFAVIGGSWRRSEWAAIVIVAMLCFLVDWKLEASPMPLPYSSTSSSSSSSASSSSLSGSTFMLALCKELNEQQESSEDPLLSVQSYNVWKQQQQLEHQITLDPRQSYLYTQLDGRVSKTWSLRYRDRQQQARESEQVALDADQFPRVLPFDQVRRWKHGRTNMFVLVDRYVVGRSVLSNDDDDGGDVDGDGDTEKQASLRISQVHEAWDGFDCLSQEYDVDLDGNPSSLVVKLTQLWDLAGIRREIRVSDAIRNALPRSERNRDEWESLFALYQDRFYLTHNGIMQQHAFILPRMHSDLLEYCHPPSQSTRKMERNFVRPPLSKIRHFARELLRALDLLHNTVGFVHGDIKLENVLVDRNGGRVSLVDFGMSHPLSEDGRVLVDGEYPRDMGTLAYNAPEILLRKPLTLQIDMWSLGCSLYALLTGHPLFQHSARLQQGSHLRKPTLLLLDILRKRGHPPQEFLHDAGDLQMRQQLELVMLGQSKWMTDEELRGPSMLSWVERALPPGHRMTQEELELVDLVDLLVQWQPEDRPSAQQALQHSFFHTKEDSWQQEKE